MDITDNDIDQAAKTRIASLFNVDTDSITFELVFGEDLKASKVSDWKYSAMDQILHDIRDVADRQTISMINAGDLIIHTVGDYCEHMKRCYHTNPKEVVHILFE